MEFSSVDIASLLLASALVFMMQVEGGLGVGGFADTWHLGKNIEYVM